MPVALRYVRERFGGTFERQSNDDIPPTEDFESAKHGQVPPRRKNLALYAEKQKRERGDVGGNKFAFLRVFSEIKVTVLGLKVLSRR